MLRWGYSLAAKSFDGPNVRVNTICRRLGVDPTGGTDPKSPNVIWGNELCDGNAALNRPEMQMIFPARADRVTIFLRAIARDGSGGENRVWIDAICMDARPEIPNEVIAPPPPPPPPKTETTYTVQRGDTLGAIAKKFGTTVNALASANNIANPSLIRVGQVLKIPGASAPPPPPQPPPPKSETTYTVQGGDTLFRIARKFGVSVDALVQANTIADPRRIKPGQVLKIPAK
jgi:LysM repeat protein